MIIESKIWGLGIGPGDPDLITLKALKILQEVDVIAYPTLDGGDSLVRSIARPHLTSNQEEIIISIPMQNERFPAQEVYDLAVNEIDSAVNVGKSIAILCEGDPFFYGSFMHLFVRLSKKHRVNVVPGVTSLAACSAALALPLATRNDIISVIPAPLDEHVIEERLLTADTVAIIKVGRHLEKIKRILRKTGDIGNAHYIERATMDNQCIKPLSQMKESTAPYFSMIVVRLSGEILNL